MATHHEFMKAAVALGARLGREVAILAEPGSSVGTAKIGVHVAKLPHSAAAALLHREPEDLTSKNLYLSYVPTEICLGLAWRSKVGRVCYMRAPSQMAEVDPKTPINSALGYADHFVTLTYVDPLRKDTKKRDAYLNALEGGAILRIQTVEGRPLDNTVGRRLSMGLAGRRPVVAIGPAVHEIFMRLVYALVRWGWNDDVAREKRPPKYALRPFGNNIGGVLVGPDNKILAWGLNMKKVNPTFHAETMMIQYWLKRNPNATSLPVGCRLYTSLECCNMCAGHIASLGHGISVFYGQKDTNIAPTALSRKVNGCQQFRALNPHVAMLDRSQAGRFGPTQTIDFLFDKGARRGETKGLFQHGAHLHPIKLAEDAKKLAEQRQQGWVKRVAAGAPAPKQGAADLVAEVERFLQELHRGGVLVGLGK